MERLADGTIVASPSDDVCKLASSLRLGETLALSSGVYKIARHIVVDKDVTIKSATGNARDVTIVRHGATALLIKGGAPSIENLTFISPESDGANASLGDEVGYRSCVSIRGGAPTLTGCRAYSAEQSGFSVRGKKTVARLVRCQARLSRDSGVFFDGGASGVLEDCVFADNGTSGVAVERTARGKWVELVRTNLVRNAMTQLNISAKGRVRANSCFASAPETLSVVVEIVESALEASRCRFVYPSPVPQGTSLKSLVRFYWLGGETVPKCAMGIKASHSKIDMKECLFERLIAAYLNEGKSSKLTMTRCKVADGVESVLINPCNWDPKLRNCDLFKAPIFYGAEEDKAWFAEFAQEKTGRREPLSDKEFDATVERLGDMSAEILGSSASSFVDQEEFEVMGFLHKRSRFGGVFVATRQLTCSAFTPPSNRRLKSLELAMATRLEDPDDQDAKNAANQKGQAHFQVGASRLPPFREKVMESLGVMLCFMEELADGNTIERYQTTSFPKKLNDPYWSGRSFIFDVLAKNPLAYETDAAKLFDYDLRTPPIPTKEFGRDEFGLLLVIEIAPKELKLAKKHGPDFIAALKQKGVWPFSDLDRELCLEL